MPWKEIGVVDSRMEFVVRVRRGERVTDLCREYGISRKTAYKFLSRFSQQGTEGLEDQSRARHTQRHRTSADVEALILKLRREHPTWGSKKLKKVLENQNEGLKLPSRSTFDVILRRHGLVTPRKVRRCVPPMLGPLTQPRAHNDVWAVDYKGQFRLGNGRLCYPLTTSDLASRYVLGCEALDNTETAPARESFEQLFATYGLPKVIRTDNGSPFASARSLFGLTKLSAFWLSNGVVHQRIEPGHPEQNGVHERMHRTLKQETTRPAGQNALQQQERFDTFRAVFNEKRPHEGIDMRRPAELYAPSDRAYQPHPLEYPLHDDLRVVSACGGIRVGRARAFLASALAGYRVGLRELDDDVFLVSFASLDLGVLHVRRGEFEAFDRLPTSSSAA